MKIKVIPERQLSQKIDLSGFQRPAWIRVRSLGTDHEQEVHASIRAIQCPLTLFFNDLDLEQASTLANAGREDLMLFTEREAEAVWLLIDALKPDFLLINCEAGIRRSASIAAAVARKYGTPEAVQTFESFPYLKNSLISEKMHQTWLNNIGGIH